MMICDTIPHHKPLGANVHTKHSHVTNGDRISLEKGTYLQAKQRLTFLGTFTMLYPYALDRLGALAPETLRTLARLIHKVERENRVYFRQADLARELHVQPLTIGRHIKKLRELGVIEPSEESNPFSVYSWRICPFFVWVKEDGAKMRDYLASLPENHPFLTWKESQ
jgi:DNA-binding transcriptional ArsR family regulator